MTELLLGPIVGGLSPSRAHLWGRATGPATLHAWLGHRPDLSDAQPAGTSALTAETGFAGVVPVRGLAADTPYYYMLTLSARPPNPAHGPYPAFTTFPPEGEPYPFNFAFGSCFRPAGKDGGQIFQALDRRRRQDDLRFILLIGDQIYADAYEHNGLEKCAIDLEEYRAVYAHTWSRPHFRNLLANLPAFMTLDDHEVDDDWTWTSSSRQQAHIPIWGRLWRWLEGAAPEERTISLKRVQDALQAYWEHQGMHAPHFHLPPRLDRTGQYALQPDDPGSLAYTFTFGLAAFFVMDTRTRRVKGRGERTVLGRQQWRALEEWLLAVKDLYPVKFLVTSSAMLFSMWVDFARDRWSGFPQERERLLRFIADNGIEGVFLLAGDLHSAHAVRADLRGPAGTSPAVWELCSTPLEQVPNRLARHTYTPVRSGSVRRQELHFCVDRRNFGLVRVDFAGVNRPRVKFQVYGRRGQLLDEVDTGSVGVG